LKAHPNQLFRQDFEKLGMKRRRDRIHGRIEQDGGRGLKSLGDPQAEEVRKDAPRQTVPHYEGTQEKIAFGPRDYVEVGR
jgi:hypothetical protein